MTLALRAMEASPGVIAEISEESGRSSPDYRGFESLLNSLHHTYPNLRLLIEGLDLAYFPQEMGGAVLVAYVADPRAPKDVWVIGMDFVSDKLKLMFVVHGQE
jgi:hypothetical protein